MAQAQTAKEQYDELLAELKTGTHTYNDRSVLAWDEYPGEADIHKGKRVVAIQYAGPEGGDGGLLREYAFDAGLIGDAVEPPPTPKTVSSQAVVTGAVKVKDTKAGA